MKNRKLNILLFALIIVAIGFGFIDRVQGSEIIPIVSGNNNPLTAYEFTRFPCEIRMSFDTPGQANWFKVNVTSPMTLDIKYGDYKVSYELFSSEALNSNEPIFTTIRRSGIYFRYGCYGSAHYPRKLISPGTYYLKFRAEDNYKNTTPKVLSVNLIEDNYMENHYTFSDNDTKESAYNYPVNTNSQIMLTAANDTEWYRFTVNEPSVAKVKINKANNPSDSGWYISGTLYSENVETKEITEVKSCQFSTGGGLLHSIDIKLDKGTYLLNLSNKDPEETPSQFVFNFSINVFKNDIFEPNDRFFEAKPFTLGDEQVVSLFGAEDEDWFEVQLPKRGAMKLTLTGDNSGGYSYSVYPKESATNFLNAPIFSTTLPENYNASLRSYSYKLDAGSYYIKLRRNNFYNIKDGLEADGIKLKIEQLPEDCMENNDTRESVFNRPYIFGETKILTLNAVNDEDWFKIDLSSATRKTSIAISVPGIVDDSIRSYLYKEDPSLPYSYYKYFDRYRSTHDYRLDPGIYYFKLLGPFEQEFNFSIKLLTEDGFEGLNSNDTWNTAYDYTAMLGKPANINLNALEDEDWFRVKIENRTALSLTIGTADNNISATYDIYSSDANEKIITTNPIKHTINLSNKAFSTILDSGVYYIKLKSTGNWSSPNDLSMTIKLLEGDEYENNDSHQASKPLLLGEERIISLHAVNDEDWFKFEILEGELVNIKFDAASTSQYMKYSLLKETTSGVAPTLIETKYPRTNGTLSSHNLVSGTYYIKIVPYSTDYTSFNNTDIKFTVYANHNVIRPTAYINHPSSTNVDVYTNIQAVFSKDIDISTIVQENISLVCGNIPVAFDIEYVVEVDKYRLIIRPKERLNYSSSYKVIISDKVKASDNGFTLLTPVSREFNTMAKPVEAMQYGIITGTVSLTPGQKALTPVAKVIVKGANYEKYLPVDAFGKFSLTNVPVGTYEVRVKIPTFIDSFASVNITANTESNVQLTPTAGDINADGIIDIFDLVAVSSNYDKSN